MLWRWLLWCCTLVASPLYPGGPGVRAQGSSEVCVWGGRGGGAQLPCRLLPAPGPHQSTGSCRPHLAPAELCLGVLAHNGSHVLGCLQKHAQDWESEVRIRDTNLYMWMSL